jgi:hypothetical protein
VALLAMALPPTLGAIALATLLSPGLPTWPAPPLVAVALLVLYPTSLSFLVTKPGANLVAGSLEEASVALVTASPLAAVAGSRTLLVFVAARIPLAIRRTVVHVLLRHFGRRARCSHAVPEIRSHL